MDITDCPNYLIYDDGRIFSKKRKKFMKPSIDKDGYLSLLLYDGEKYKRFSIHRLIALHYIPNPENKQTVDHIDRNKTNNKIENLRWATLTEQQINKNWKGNQKKHKYIYKSNKTDSIVRIERLNIARNFKTIQQALVYKFFIILQYKL